MTSNRYSWVALDLDDTLLGPGREVGSTARTAVSLVQRCGGVAVLATGRPYASAQLFARRLGIRGPVVANSGAVIRDASGTPIRDLFLDPEVVREVLKEVATRGLGAYVYRGEGTWATREHADTARYARILEEPIVVWEDPDPDGVHAIAIRTPVEDEDGVDAYLSDSLGPRAIILRTLPSLVEILPPDASKGSALALLADRLGRPLRELVAIGDGFGDLDMLDVAGLGVLVANASESLWSRADRVTEAPYAAGVLDVVREHFCREG